MTNFMMDYNKYQSDTMVGRNRDFMLGVKRGKEECAPIIKELGEELARVKLSLPDSVPSSLYEAVMQEKDGLISDHEDTIARFEKRIAMLERRYATRGKTLARVREARARERANSKSNYETFKRVYEDRDRLRVEIERLLEELARARKAGAEVEVEMTVKNHYIQMFVEKGWVPRDTGFTYVDDRRMGCICTVKQEHIDALNRYSTYLKEHKTP